MMFGYKLKSCSVYRINRDGSCAWGFGCDLRHYCFVGGVYFKDLPANMLGSFIIGLVGTSNMLGITENRAVGLLPADHTWQTNIPLQTGGFLNAFGRFLTEIVCKD